MTRIFVHFVVVLWFASCALQVNAATYNIADGDVAGLIAAIHASNANPGPDIINLAPGGTYTLTYAAGPDSWHGDTGLPIVQGTVSQHEFLTINGNGATIQRSDAPGTPDFRIFYALYANVVLDGIIIRGGRGLGPNRCGGGGLYLNVATTLIRNSTITENWANEGGGICNTGTTNILTVENSTISHNTAFGARTGGGILNFAGGPILISNSTLYENRADGSSGFEGRGDSIADAFSPPDSIEIKNSIMASPTRGAGVECEFVKLVSLGHNIIGDNSCFITLGTGDVIVPDLTLGPLANNGGTTPTHALMAGSPAIDAIPIADCTTVSGSPVATDQRGVARPSGVRCDIGSFELEGDNTPPLIAPVVVGILGQNSWHVSDVEISWTVPDPETEISSSTGCEVQFVVSDTAGVTFTCTATSGGGTATESVTIKRDATAPIITLNSPTNGSYLLNQPANVSFSCSDAMSGVATCSGSAADGSALDTSSTGAKSFTVNATDNAGNAANANVNYTVGYGVQALYDQTKAHKSGSTVPIKIRLVDANGANVSSPDLLPHAISVIQVSSQASTEFGDAGNSNPDFDFRYDADLGGYIYNLKTTGFGTGSYMLNFTAGGPTPVYSVGFQVRQ